ncbi:hypothetical protein ACLKA7_007594 [Drosophila subpalustris]
MQVGIGKEVLTDRPFQKIYSDFLGKYPRSKRGHAWIFIVVNHFSMFTFLKAMRDTSAADVVNFLLHEEAMIKAFGIAHLRTPVYSPQSNAAERVNRSVLSAIRTYLDHDHREWDAYCPGVEVSIRNAVRKATGVTPFFAVFGQHKAGEHNSLSSRGKYYVTECRRAYNSTSTFINTFGQLSAEKTKAAMSQHPKVSPLHFTRYASVAHRNSNDQLDPTPG